jgi:hypothetical protein
MRAGAMLERRGAAADIAEAMEWYANGAGTAIRNSKTGMITATFCWEVARRFDLADSEHYIQDAALAMAWYGRGIEVGGQLCLQRWLEACASGESGLAPGADVVLERVRTFRAEHRVDFSRTDRVVKALRQRAAECSEPEARKWQEAAKLLRQT